MPTMGETLDLEELVITVYAALDDALAQAGIRAQAGKLVPRPGPAPDVDWSGSPYSGARKLLKRSELRLAARIAQ